VATNDFIIDVNEIDFEYEVIAYSQNTPVVVDFWAEWCRPCKTLSPILEKIASEAQGNFRLAKVDVDGNPNLALRFSVRNIPTVKAFIQGEVVSEFVGLLPEPRIRDFLSKLIPPSSINLTLEKANSLLGQHLWHDAEILFREILEKNTEMPVALLGLSKALLAEGQVKEPLNILVNFPASNLYAKAQVLVPLGKAMFNAEQDLLPDEIDLDSTFKNSLRLAMRGNFPAAVDGLLDLLRQDKKYRNNVARQVVLALLEILGEEDPQTRQYRSELASILF
jgi:putative thioredoxin